MVQNYRIGQHHVGLRIKVALILALICGILISTLPVASALVAGQSTRHRSLLLASVQLQPGRSAAISSDIRIPRTIVGEPLAVAASVLAKLGLKDRIRGTKLSTTIKRGDVATTVPAPGTEVSPETVVVLVPGVAANTIPSKKVVIPYKVIGQYLQTDVAILTRLGLKYRVSSFIPCESIKPGRVVSTVPFAGTNTSRGTTVALGICEAGATTQTNHESSRLVTVPEAILQQPLAVAIAELQQLGFNVVCGSGNATANLDVPIGAVASTSPAAGDEAADGSTVVVSFSYSFAVRLAKNTKVAIPSYIIGETPAEASALLTGLGLNPYFGSPETTSVIQPGDVASTLPAAGTFGFTDEQIEVHLARAPLGVEPPLVIIPSVVGLPLAVASATLTAVGLKYSTVAGEPSSSIQPGTILSMSPSPGSRVSRSSEVVLTVAESVFPTTTVPPSTTVPPTTTTSTTLQTVATTSTTLPLVSAPTVAGILPSGGPALGGTSVTITGTGFSAPATVDFGTTPATNVTVLSNSSISATSPAGTGTVGVSVSDQGGTSQTSSADEFAYQPSAPAPEADSTYPNGAIIDFSGTDYVFAGGYGFEVATPAQLAAVQAVDAAIVLTAPSGGNPPAATAPRSGTLVTTPGAGSTVYVAGTDGELHAFADPTELVADGYDSAMLVTVPNLTGLTIGSPVDVEGIAGTALGTSADGAIVDSSGTYYVYAGGRAFPIPNSTVLATIRSLDSATVLTGTVGSADQAATVANGTVLNIANVPGTGFVGYTSELFQFASQSQVDSDGYGGTAAVPVPSVDGITVA